MLAIVYVARAVIVIFAFQVGEQGSWTTESLRVMGHELEIHPLLAIFMIGGAVGGIVGIYLSAPLVAALRAVWHRFAPAAQHVETEHDWLRSL